MVRALCVVALFLGSSLAEAQPTRVWGSAGLGLSGDTEGFGPSGRLGVHVVRGRLVGVGRLAAYSGGDTGIDGLFGAVRSETIDGALLVGYVVGRGRGTLAYVAAGPALASGREVLGRETPPCGFSCGTERREFGPSPGLAVEGGAVVRGLGPIGLGATLHGVLVESRPAAGLTLSLTLGAPR